MPAFGWGVPPTVVSDPKGPEDHRHAKIVLDEYGQYHTSPHAYIIERAAEVLEADGNTNWADGVAHFHPAFVDGCMWPDRMGPDLRIIVDLWTTLPIPMKVKSWSFRICNYASLDHYYNPTHAAAGPPQALPSSLLP
ncbi:MAG: hypothetical protein AB7Y46_12100, partial [Armatimonadota bacterium]